MDFFYFLVTGSKAWDPIYHANFFNGGGFSHGVICALIVGAVCAIAFYFGCCNSNKSSKMANIGVWAGALAISAVLTFFYADMIIIGQSGVTDNKSMMRTYSFYKANEDYYINRTGQPNISQTEITDLAQKRTEIKSNLDKGGDVRFDFNLTTSILAMVFFFLISICVKRFTINGRSIPFLKP